MELLNVALTIDEQYLINATESTINFFVCKEATIPGFGTNITVGSLSVSSLVGSLSENFKDNEPKNTASKRPQVSQALSPAKRTKSEKPLFAKAAQIVSPHVSCVADNVFVKKLEDERRIR